MPLNERQAFPAVSEKAYAKLNISLDVTAKRDDGYHDMLMIMQTVSLCDELTITPEKSGVVHALTGLPYVPGDKRNLAVRAALKFLELVGDEGRGMKIAIRKNIPVGAGMAGGSADAAAVLRALNRAYGGPLTPEQLCAAGETVGSDVAFCLRGGTYLASGRGEILTPLPPLPPPPLPTARPPSTSPTRRRPSPPTALPRLHPASSLPPATSSASSPQASWLSTSRQRTSASSSSGSCSTAPRPMPSSSSSPSTASSPPPMPTSSTNSSPTSKPTASR